MILKIKTPEGDKKDYIFYGGIKSIQTNYGLFGSWKHSNFNHWITKKGSKSPDGLYVLVIHAVFNDKHSESFIISTHVYIMNDEGKTIEQLYNI